MALPSSLLARKRITKAHNGRETRGVLSGSTTKTVGASAWSTFNHFLSSSLLFLVPPLVYLIILAASSSWLSCPWSTIVVQHFSSVNSAGIVCLIYAYWIPACTYFLYLKRPHALNAVKYQTFEIPWRFQRDHVSHMRLDRLRRALLPGRTSGNATRSASASEMTIFVDIPTTGTIALTVRPSTTVLEIRRAICHRGYKACSEQDPMYLMGIWRPLSSYERLSDLGVGSLCHFLMLPRLLGGGSDVVLDENGWEQGALNPDGSLKAAEDIDWGTDPGAKDADAAGPSSRPSRGKNERMEQIIHDLSSDDEARTNGRKRKLKPRAVRKSNTKGKAKQDESDPDDPAYSGSGSSGEGSDSEPDIKVTNEELAESLPTKTIPAGTSRHPKKAQEKAQEKKKRAAKKRRTDEPENSKSIAATPSESSNTADEPKEPGYRNPIRLFFEDVTETNHGKPAEKGDKFYRCYHGESKSILKMSKAMRNCLNGLTGHLKSHAKDMYQLFEILKARKTPATSEEIEIAQGRKTFEKRADLLKFIASCAAASETRQQTLRESLARASEKNLGDWDQAEFEKLLVEWLVGCDQPFQEVERPEFRRLLEYVHHRAPALHIPSSSTIERRVTEMGTTLQEDLKAFFASLQGMIAISLDAWTSPNGYSFIAIVAHYITNDGKLEELLIDFQELMGEHSGENMAEVVWNTLEIYGLTGLKNWAKPPSIKFTVFNHAMILNICI